MKNKILKLCTIALAIEFGMFIGYKLGKRQYCISRFNGALILAEAKVDTLYGDGTFMYGLRRILKDGNNEFYSFRLQLPHENSPSNTIVNVDLRGHNPVVSIEEYQMSQ